MVRSPLAMGSLFALILLGACQGGTPTPSSSPAPAPEAPPPAVAARPAVEDDADPTTLDGVYTIAQAARGEALYQAECSECHETTDWTEGGFQNRWSGQSTYQLWYYINDRMPYDDPWSLSRQQVTDMLSFILQLNDLPAGSVEMGTEDDDIDRYWIVWNDR